MPLYDYKCPVCAARREIMKPVAELDRRESCHKCEGPMLRQVSAARVVTDYAPYTCPITGKLIEGRAAHRENLAQHGCRVLEPGEADQAARARRASDEQVENAMAETAAHLVANLPQDKKERLAAELDHGVDLSITRN